MPEQTSRSFRLARAGSVIVAAFVAGCSSHRPASIHVGAAPPAGCDFFDGFGDGVFPAGEWIVRPGEAGGAAGSVVEAGGELLIGEGTLVETARRWGPAFEMTARFRHWPPGQPAGGVRFRFGATGDTDWYEATARTDEDGGASQLIHEAAGTAPWGYRATAIQAGPWYRSRVRVDPAKIEFELLRDDGTPVGPPVRALNDGVPAAPFGIRVGAANGGGIIDWVCLRRL